MGESFGVTKTCMSNKNSVVIKSSDYYYNWKHPNGKFSVSRCIKEISHKTLQKLLTDY